MLYSFFERAPVSSGCARDHDKEEGDTNPQCIIEFTPSINHCACHTSSSNPNMFENASWAWTNWPRIPTSKWHWSTAQDAGPISSAGMIRPIDRSIASG